MRKTIAALLMIAIALSLTACDRTQTSDDKAGMEIDAVSISEKIVPPFYSLVGVEREGGIWTSNHLTEYGGIAYYIGSDSEKEYIRSFDPNSASDKEIFSSIARYFVAKRSLSGIFLCPSGNLAFRLSRFRTVD